jgi:hypothetical protein
MESDRGMNLDGGLETCGLELGGAGGIIEWGRLARTMRCAGGRWMKRVAGTMAAVDEMRCAGGRWMKRVAGCWICEGGMRGIGCG